MTKYTDDRRIQELIGNNDKIPPQQRSSVHYMPSDTLDVHNIIFDISYQEKCFCKKGECGRDSNEARSQRPMHPGHSCSVLISFKDSYSPCGGHRLVLKGEVVGWPRWPSTQMVYPLSPVIYHVD